ncbi:MAG: Nif3-like dinuclear metal center hexameric protein [Thermoleophilia bacterium]
MAILVHEFLEILEDLAPESLAEDWDNVGLQVGSLDDSISSVMVAIDVTQETIDEASKLACNLILTHHPLIFQPLSSISDESSTGRLIRSVSREGIAVVAAHTNLDSARHGLADTLAGLMELSGTKPIVPAPTGWSKLVVFVPPDDLDRVRSALFKAGAGVIGDYSHCSFATEGTGTFLPEKGANPAIGKVGRDENVGEARLEMIFPPERHQDVIDALLLTHSYEEPAFDIYALENMERQTGAGRAGELDSETSLENFAGLLAELFGLDTVRYAGLPDRLIRRVAVVPGSGADYIDLCVGNTDVLVTGDIKYHQTLHAARVGLALVDIPHEVSETLALESWSVRLAKVLEPRGIKVSNSRVAPVLWQTTSGRRIKSAPASDKVKIEHEENSMHHLYVDGGSRGNPGPAGIGAVLASDAGEVVDTLADYIGEATNNVAEYQAVISGVEMALDHGILQLAIFSDSELIVRQLEGRYKVKNEGLRPYYQQAKSILSRLEEYEITAIPREANTHADELVNAALDEAAKS